MPCWGWSVAVNPRDSELQPHPKTRFFLACLQIALQTSCTTLIRDGFNTLCSSLISTVPGCRHGWKQRGGGEVVVRLHHPLLPIMEGSSISFCKEMGERIWSRLLAHLWGWHLLICTSLPSVPSCVWGIGVTGSQFSPRLSFYSRHPPHLQPTCNSNCTPHWCSNCFPLGHFVDPRFKSVVLMPLQLVWIFPHSANIYTV